MAKLDFNEIRRNLVSTLIRLPVVMTFPGRTSLLVGLPPVALNRDEHMAQLDLNTIVSELQRLGRLADEGGKRPLMVIVENALDYVPPTGDVAEALNGVKRQLEEFYGGDVQPAPTEMPVIAPEALIFGQQRDTRLPLDFINRAQAVAHSVARLTVPRIFDGVQRRNEAAFGTGWLVAPGVLITNHHVIEARFRNRGEDVAKESDFRAQAEQVVAWFDYQREGVEKPDGPECIGAQLLASDQQLDYAVVQLNDAYKLVGPGVSERRRLPLAPQLSSLQRGDRLNIVQHPNGGPLRLAIRNNFYVQPGASGDFLHYQTDTEPGASGSPVCDDNWQVVALHHAAVSVDEQQVPQEVVNGKPVAVRVLNEGVAIHSILNHLSADLRMQILNAQPIFS